MATLYVRDDPGSPAYGFGTGLSGFNALKAILKGCLVYGYTGKAAAGWALIAEGTNYIVLRNGTGSGYVCLTDVGGAIVCYLSQTYAGMSGNYMTGDGLKTGVSASNAVTHRVCRTSLMVYASASSTWSVVADSKTFIINMCGHSNNYAINHTYNGEPALCLYVGECSNSFFIAMGGENISSGSTVAYFSGTRGFTSIKDPSTGLLVDSGSLSGVDTPGQDSIPSLNEYMTGGLITKLTKACLVPVAWGVNGSEIGNLRGIATEPRLGYRNPSIANPMLGGATPTFRNASDSLDLGDGYKYQALVKSFSTPFAMATTNPAFW